MDRTLLYAALGGAGLYLLLRRRPEKKPDLEHVLIPGVGHVPLLNEPVAEQAIDAFLDKVQPNG